MTRTVEIGPFTFDYSLEQRVMYVSQTEFDEVLGSIENIYLVDWQEFVDGMSG